MFLYFQFFFFLLIPRLGDQKTFSFLSLSLEKFFFFFFCCGHFCSLISKGVSHLELSSASRRQFFSFSLFFFFVEIQKWSKGKVRDKLNNQVLFDKATYEKLLKEVPTYKLITPSVVSERLKVRGSLARRALNELLHKGFSLKFF